MKAAFVTLFVLIALFSSVKTQEDQSNTQSFDSSLRIPTGITNQPPADQPPTESDVPPQQDTTTDVVPPTNTNTDVVPPTNTNVDAGVPAGSRGAYVRPPGYVRRPGYTRPPGYQRGSGVRPTGPRGGYHRGGNGGYSNGGALCNPITGIRARQGGIYAGVLNAVGVRAGNCGGNQGGDQAGPVNPITGIRARPGSLYAAVLNGAGVGRQQGGEAGLVNPITGIRARPGSIYGSLLSAAGVNANANQATSGLLGNTAIGQAINRAGGLLATADESNNFQSASAAQSAVPGWAIAIFVIASILLVALIVVSVQLMVLIRNS